VITWLAFNVHGGEASGLEAALALIYQLAAGRDAETQLVLDSSVVVIDPLQNPDGHERHVQDWLRNRSVLGIPTTPDAMRTYLKSIESAEAEKRAVERSRQAQASQQTLDFDRRADQVKSALETIEEKIRKLEPLAQSKPPATTEFDARIGQYEAEMKKEQDGTGSCGPAGEGECFKRYMAERDKAAREKALSIERAEAAARTAADQLIALRKEKIDKEVELANIVDKARLAGHEITIDPRASALDVAAKLPKKIADLQSTVGQYGIELQQALDALNSGFTPEKYARVVERCRSLLPITMIGDFTQTLGITVSAAMDTDASSW